MRKIVSIVILILVMTFMLTGCGNSQYKSLGRKNAVQYIEDKYGFKPSVKNVISQNITVVRFRLAHLLKPVMFMLR